MLKMLLLARVTIATYCCYVTTQVFEAARFSLGHSMMQFLAN